MAEDGAAQRLLDCVANAPPGEVAAELMAVFATRGSVYGIMPLIEWLFRDCPSPKRYSSALRGYQQLLRDPMLEAVQLLDHSELIFSCSEDKWRASRLGRATLVAGKAAVRQRIKDRTGL